MMAHVCVCICLYIYIYILCVCVCVCVCVSEPVSVRSPVFPVEDLFLKKCKKKIEAISERDMWADGEFMTEKDMRDNGYPESLTCILCSRIES